MRITNCKVNHLTNPLGFCLDGTRFSWMVEDTEAQSQTAARIIVKCHDEPKSDADWDVMETVADTGWADLDSLATRIELKLKPRTRYSWKVCVRADNEEEASSEENWFETAKMDEPWEAKWIGCDDSENRHPVFSRDISPKKPVKSARLYICGLGLYEAAWDGKKIGDEYLTPYCNNYHNFVQYQTFDISQELKKSGTLSVTLGNGWYKGRFGFSRKQPYYGDSWKLLAEIRISYTDGDEEVIGTDEGWKLTRSKIYFSNIYDGECRDDTLEALPEEHAILTSPPQGSLEPRRSTPVRAREELSVKEVIHTPKGETVLDIGQEITGIFRLRVNEPKGTKVRLQFGEILQGGNFYRDNLRSAKAEYIYISDGIRHELEPKFTFYGYRYIKVEGIKDIKAEDFTAIALYSEIAETGSLTTGNDLINQLLSNVSWSHRDNFLDVPTDCPQRDERMGWTGDAQVFAPTACYLRDCYAFFSKYLYDMALEQRERGGEAPNTVPSFGNDDTSAAWGDAAAMIPWTLYEFYGDPSVLEIQYPSMKAWVEYIRDVDGDDHGWRRHFHFGDWLSLDVWDADERQGGTDLGYVADVMYYASTLIVTKTARLLHIQDDVRTYETLSDEILAGIRQEYFTPTGRLAVPTQTGYLLALEYELWPDARALSRGLVDTLNKSGGRLQTGFVGTPLLCPILTEIGETERAFDLLLSEDYPGWLYAVKLGATTIWERWNSLDTKGTIAENGMNSLNHYSYGSIAGWIYGYVAGLRSAEPGFRKAILSPHISAALGTVELSYLSAAGPWSLSWKVLADGDVEYHCSVPFGCSARLELPYGGGSYDLTPGDYDYTYTPDKPLRGRFNTNVPLAALLANRRVKALLTRAIPQIGALPQSMAHMSMREISRMMGGRISEEDLDKLDAILMDL